MGVYEALTRDQKIKQVERALDFVGTMVADRDDGETYLGEYQKLEAELQSLRSLDDAKERIRLRLAQRSMKLAA